MKTMSHRSGFTLVELLVVISIIAMLAGLLLPAINAARENGRRIQCVSNQSQVAYALLNYEHTRGSFPALRAPLNPTDYWALVASTGGGTIASGDAPLAATELTWVSYILPYMEQTAAWDLVSKGNVVNNASNPSTMALYGLVIPVMQCKSGGISPGDSRVSYVANAGPLNIADDQEFGKADRTQKDEKMFTIFFDHFTVSVSGPTPAFGEWLGATTSSVRNTTKISVDNISSMDGTSMTILLSENEDAGHWIWHAPNIVDIPVASQVRITAAVGAPVYHDSNGADVAEPGGIAEVESLLGFCYPNAFNTTYIGTTTAIESETPIYTATTTYFPPYFINERRPSATPPGVRPLTARPSSGHPGVVVAAFCDRGTRVLRDDMNRLVFVQLCRPGSGVIFNPRDLGW